MANESFALNYDPPRDVSRSLIAEIAFVALLLMMFVGLSPFAPPPSPTTVNMAAPAPGDFLRQIIFLGIFFPVLFASTLQRGWDVFRVVPFALIAMLAWCFFSMGWSGAPDVTMRRSALAAILVISTIASVDLVGGPRAFLLWRIVLAIVLALNWLSIPLIETAVHLPGEIDPSLVGDWRGLYGQKNTAGAVCVLTALLFLFSRNGRGNWIGWLVAVAALGFLAMTRSKTSIALFPVALVAGLAYGIAWRDSLSRAIFLCGAILMAGIASLLLLLNWDFILKLLTDPASFTGRAEIWQAILAYMHDHPLLGAGFGTIAHTGTLSPLHDYARGNWVETIADSHNGYLQILATTGGIGLLLALLAMVVGPLCRFWPLEPARTGFKALLFAIFVFVLLHNFLETDFLESDNSLWFAFLVMLASLKTRDNSLTLRP
ncbi:MAG: O-antigen ligase family protein [Alphaproteobacteria bacterium]|nr:O-antigen ligase family protein [Alphaproteobacteria bacterium]